jgi:hypothetical protein
LYIVIHSQSGGTAEEEGVNVGVEGGVEAGVCVLVGDGVTVEGGVEAGVCVCVLVIVGVGVIEGIPEQFDTLSIIPVEPTLTAHLSDPPNCIKYMPDPGVGVHVIDNELLIYS